MTKISAVIITMNEEKYIERCFNSVNKVVDEIIVVDSFSSDNTEMICRRLNVNFFQHEFTGFMNQKNYAISLASNKYVLSIDADEALSDELIDSLSAIKTDLAHDGYLFNRLNNYCGKWIRHSAWYPDRQLRLFNREKGKFGPVNVHERFIMVPGCSISRIKGDLLHWPYETEDEFLKNMELYADIAAREYYKAGKKVFWFTPALHMVWRFILTYILHLGFLNGKSGYTICSKGAWSSYLKYARLRRLWNEGKQLPG
jgi:glycosyltransferase involved in cell wall biosynthesis